MALVTFMGTLAASIPEHWLDRVHPHGECWLWSGYKKNGYGHANVGGKRVRVHKYVYEHEVGPVPPGLVLDHFVCDTRACLRPDHMQPTTIGDNAARPKREQTHCKREHPLDDAWVDKSGHRKCRVCRSMRRAAR